ncbi:hypothetical protein THERMOT_897, partial [Bathymodiolus thermophilus thioautotrophic gill symbiont]|uniref:cadherin repeat domain-containing protein n=1 Tax=Bathymodiolus thermophilus thioautotrophic gill symbiont TaxID=2360 RepID=UPI00192B01A2
MNIFNRFIIASFYLLALSTQTLALDFTQAIKDTTYVLSDAQKTIRVTLDDYALLLNANNRFFDESNNKINANEFIGFGVGVGIIAPFKVKYFAGTQVLYKTWDLTFQSSTILEIKKQGGKRFTFQTLYDTNAAIPSLFISVSTNGALSPLIPQRTINFCWEDCGTLTITSTNNLNTNEGTNLEHTLTASDTAATFSIIENTSGLFSLSGTNNTTLTFNGTTTEYEVTESYAVKVKATTGDGDDKNTEQTITVTINNVPKNTITISDQDLSVNENSPINANVGTVDTSGAITNYTIINGNNAGFFKINATTGQIQVAKTGLDYETTQSYTLTIKITGTDAEGKTAKITITINNLKENTITIANQTRFIDENSAIGTNIDSSLTTAGVVTSFAIVSGNNDGFFAINNTGQIQIAKLGLDHETKQVYILTIKITGTDAKDETAQITIRLNNLNDTTPANITLSKKNIVLGEPAGTVIGTLFATDPDDGDLIYTVNDTNNFEISDNKLKIKQVTTEIRTYPITITANDSLHTSEPQSFNITITATYIAAPVISQFSITQGENKGPLISKDGGEVTVSASAGTGTYAWSSDDFSNTSTNKTFVFNPQSVNVGTRTITLKVTAGDFSSERVLKLKLVDTYPNGRTDINGNGISDSKELRNSNNELLTVTNKKITSSGDTRILPSIMGEDSGQLTPDQLKQYRVANHLSDYTKDTLTTGDIYSYIVEGLSATGDSTQVTIELSTPIPANAVLRQYSLATGWRNFVVGNNNIQSKINASNVCTDTDGTWQTGLITGATCLKLTLKDGGENDADDNHANGVVESTISIATPVVVGGNDDSDD